MVDICTALFILIMINSTDAASCDRVMLVFGCPVILYVILLYRRYSFQLYRVFIENENWQNQTQNTSKV